MIFCDQSKLISGKASTSIGGFELKVSWDNPEELPYESCSKLGVINPAQ